ncbi:MAG: AEC family transporter [Anaerorhabdus sp.]
MDILFALIPQIAQMFILMSIGYGLFKAGKLSNETVKQLSWILVNIVIPCVLFNSFVREFQIVEFRRFGVVVAYSVLAILIGVVVSKIMFKKNQHLEQFGVVFSNASFIGIPIILALFGEGALFYLSAYMVIFILFVFTYGLFLISQKPDEIQLIRIIKNPNIIAIILGLCVYVLSINLPDLATTTIKMVGTMNTPLSMMILGVYLAKRNMSELLRNKKSYLVAFGRLILVPLVTIAVLTVLPGDGMLKMVVVVVNAVPGAVMLALFADLYQKDATQAAQYVSFSTLLCLVTLPVIVLVAQYFLL